jgi:tRNA(Ile2) C34 agmatinyltransferase TiaS
MVLGGQPLSMATITMVNIVSTSVMEKGHTIGAMVASIRVGLPTIVEKVMAFIHGQMVPNTKVISETANTMDKDRIG